MDVSGALKEFYARRGRPLQQSGHPDRRIDIHEADNEWVVVNLDTGWERNERRDASLFVSKRLWCPGFFVLVYDFFWGYELFDRGEIFDHFIQWPDEEEAPWLFPGEDRRGNVDVVAQHLPFLDMSVIAPYIQQQSFDYSWEHRADPHARGGKVHPNDEFQRYETYVVLDFLRALGIHVGFVDNIVTLDSPIVCTGYIMEW